MLWRRWMVTIGLMISGLVSEGSAQATQKRLVAHSWDLLQVRPAEVARNVDAFAELPIDGVSLALRLEPEPGVRVGFDTIMTDPLWDRAWFTEEVEHLKRCASRSLQHNFLTSFWAPRRRLAWDDDAAWARFASNLGVLAELAHAGGAKGVLLDPEDYPGTGQYEHQAGDPPFAEATALARARGVEVMRAMSEPYPDITILTFWMLSLRTSYYMGYGDPCALVAAAGDLWPAFINGMLDALPPSARLVDGNEHGYRFEGANQDFYLSAWATQNKAIALVAPENWNKYRTQVLTGFGLYLDMYTNSSDSPWYFGPLAGSRLNHLAVNCTQALDAASEYVWVYGERLDWIEWRDVTRKTNPTWEEVLPGFTEALALARRPGDAAKVIARRRDAGDLVNLLSNGECVPPEGLSGDGFHQRRLPADWAFWQHEAKAQGVFGIDGGLGRGDQSSLKAEGVADGCFIGKVPATAGMNYVVEAYAQGVAPQIRVRWNRQGTWFAEVKDVAIGFGEPGPDGWRHGIGLVQVPHGADAIVVLLGMRQGEGEETWFDSAGVYSLSAQ
ncbi:MAG: hypothetical protein PHF14_14850 [Verrucomicrobiota bacterium]|nr:hypothetical protein [Verrucomicrobiota bacterium]